MGEWYVNKFRFSVQFWTEISAETERCNDTETETETEMHTKTKISAETESFRSLVRMGSIRNPKVRSS
jgi:hypothetical protein